MLHKNGSTSASYYSYCMPVPYMALSSMTLLEALYEKLPSFTIEATLLEICLSYCYTPERTGNFKVALPFLVLLYINGRYKIADVGTRVVPTCTRNNCSTVELRCSQKYSFAHFSIIFLRS